MNDNINKKFLNKIFKKRFGDTLIEILTAIAILALIIPSLFAAQSGSLKAIIELKRSDICRWGAQWWFSRLPDFNEINEAKIKSMPDKTPDGSVKFNLKECTTETNGAIKIVLEVQAVNYKKTLTVTRIL